MTENEFEKIETLLKKISKIREKAYQEAESRGENFNIFQVLKLGTKEVLLHTPFLFEVLSPNGTHGFGDTFLTIFIEILVEKFNIYKEINIKKLSVQKDKYIGEVNGVYTEGGIIDIYLESEDYSIIIENKTSKGGNVDQRNQLLRYKNFLNNKGILFYLTLNGDTASEYSTEKLKSNQDYFCLSYERDILFWLEKCLEKIEQKPILQATIEQYIILIKKLTGIINNKEMETAIIDLLIENYNEAELIKKNWDEVLKKLRRQIANEVKKQLIERHQILKETVYVNHESKWPSVFIKGDKWGKSVKVYLQSKELMSSGFEFGVVKSEEENLLTKEQIKNKLPNLNCNAIKSKYGWIAKETISINKEFLCSIENFAQHLSQKMKTYYDTINKDWK